VEGKVETRHKKLPFQAILGYDWGEDGDKIKATL